MALSNYLAKKLQDFHLGSQSFTAPATVYLALYTAAPSAGGGGTEVSGGSYVRKSITNNNTNFPDTVLGTGEKYLGVETAMATATADWGIITSWALLDASSGGNLLHFGTLTAPITILNGDIFRFPAGASGLKITAS